MSQVTLTIGGNSHRVSCADGEEAHIIKLGAMIDAKLQAMGGNRSAQQAENLLFAALLLADDLHEAKQVPTPNAPPAVPAAKARESVPNIAPMLDQLAESLELCADKLEAAALTS